MQVTPTRSGLPSVYIKCICAQVALHVRARGTHGVIDLARLRSTARLLSPLYTLSRTGAGRPPYTVVRGATVVLGRNLDSLITLFHKHQLIL